MSLALTRPKWSLWELIKQVLNVRSANQRVDQTRRIIQETLALIETNREANVRLEKTNVELEAENKHLIEILKTYSFVDPNAKCPFCGATEGSLETKQDFSKEAYVEHTCSVCKGHWPEATIYEDAGKLWKANQTLSDIPIAVPPGEGVRRV